MNTHTIVSCCHHKYTQALYFSFGNKLSIAGIDQYLLSHSSDKFDGVQAMLFGILAELKKFFKMGLTSQCKKLLGNLLFLY